METLKSAINSYFDSVRADDVPAVRALLRQRPEIVHARWPARGNADGLMRSLGPPPYDRHVWFPAPINPDDPGDPRYTSAPLIYTRNDDMVQLLVEAGADVNALGSSGIVELLDWHSTPLFRAAHDGRLRSVKLLVEHGADFSRQNPDGTNQALTTAAENAALDVCDYLLSQGARPDIISAAMLGLAADVTRLLSEDPNLIAFRDQHARSALDVALLMDTFRREIPQTPRHDEVADILVTAGSPLELAHAASLGRMDLVTRILESDPGAIDRRRPTAALLTGGATFENALDAAARRKRTEVVEYLTQINGI